MGFRPGYNDYRQFERFSSQNITWVTRKREYSVYRIKENLPVNVSQRKRGVQKDQIIVMGYPNNR